MSSINVGDLTFGVFPIRFLLHLLIPAVPFVRGKSARVKCPVLGCRSLYHVSYGAARIYPVLPNTPAQEVHVQPSTVNSQPTLPNKGPYLQLSCLKKTCKCDIF